MILKLFRSSAALSFVVLSATAQSAPAGSTSEAFLGAYDAYRAGDALKLARYSKRLHGDLLEPWGDYWRLAVRLDDASDADVQAFLAAHDKTYVAELLRGDWLKVLGRRRAWKEFDREAAGFPRPDLEIQCYQWSSRIARDDQSAREE